MQGSEVLQTNRANKRQIVSEPPHDPFHSLCLSTPHLHPVMLYIAQSPRLLVFLSLIFLTLQGPRKSSQHHNSTRLQPKTRHFVKFRWLEALLL
jgi:hypothetical protein